MANYIIAIFTILFSSISFAASCCGGGAGSSSIITSDDRVKLQFNYKNSAYLYDVDTDGDVTKRSPENSEVLESFKVSTAYQFDNYFQVAIGASVSKVTKKTSRVRESETNIADINITVGYEFLKEQYFSYWKPRGFVYVTQVLPTGNSKYETKSRLQTDVTGSGFHQTRLGVMFFKLIKEFDFTLDSNLTYYFKERFSNEEVYRYPTIESSLSFGYSPSMGDLRIGGGAAFKYDGHSELIFNNGTRQDSEGIFVTTLNLSLSYMLNDISYGVIYADQTILSGSKNTSLERSLSINLAKAFPL